MQSNATYNNSESLNDTTHGPKVDYFDRLGLTALSVLVLLVSLFGMVANGTVIWILSFHMKRNSFTTYILNLSIADFVLLTVLVPDCICWILTFSKYMKYPDVLILLLSRLCIFTFSTSQYLLAAISIDRCVCLFFPLWHKCRRPPHLSTTVCVTIWILTFPISAIDFALHLSKVDVDLWYYQYLLNAVLSLPAMSISTIAMLMKVFFISPHHKRGKFLTAIFLALLFFLFFGFPLSATLLFFRYNIPPFFHYYSHIGATLNSAINPVIYFLLGRDKKSLSRKGITKIFVKLFQEEESCKDNVESSLETNL